MVVLMLFNESAKLSYKSVLGPFLFASNGHGTCFPNLCDRPRKNESANARAMPLLCSAVLGTDILGTSNIAASDLKRALQSLACAKHKILRNPAVPAVRYRGAAARGRARDSIIAL